MFVSVALHAATVYAVTRPHITSNTDRMPFFDWMMNAFHLIITPVFFFVGGFFTVIMLRRKSVGTFVRERLVRTGIPLLTTALTLNVVELYLRWRDAGGDLGFFGFLTSGAYLSIVAEAGWQLHLWFLLCLIPFFMLCAAVHRLVPQDSAIRRLSIGMSDRLGRWTEHSFGAVLFLLALAAVNFVNFGILAKVPGAYDVVIPGIIPLYRMFSELPFFILGLMAAASPALLGAIWRWRSWMPVAALAMFVWAPIPSDADGKSEAMQMFTLYANQLAIWVLVFFVLQFFHRFYAESSPTRAWLADAALSMYLVHHSLVYIYGDLFTEVDWHPVVEFGLVAGLAAVTVLAFHEFGIRRSATLRLLFNGKTDLVRKIEGVPAKPGAR